MPEAVVDGELAFDPYVQRCAVVLCRTEHGNFHVGLLHRAAPGRAAVLHLGWLDYLSMTWPWLRLWVCPETEPEKLMTAAGYCRRIWTKFQEKGVFPYALGDFASTFDLSGRLVLAPGSRGLTCATFVMAVFRTSGVELVDEDEWPIRVDDDRGWLQVIAGFARADHLAVLQEQVEEGVARVHPHELLGACTLSPLPVDFSRVPAAAAQVVAKLDTAIGR
ncbi:MAG: hypothetical protein ABMA64_39970 [Myxococcota bacterium]